MCLRLDCAPSDNGEWLFADPIRGYTEKREPQRRQICSYTGSTDIPELILSGWKRTQDNLCQTVIHRLP